jgi:hypothetical protein
MAREPGPQRYYAAQVGAALVAVGVLILIPSGLCTAYAGAALLITGELGLVTILILAVLIAGGGGLLVRLGSKLRRNS